MSKLVWSPVLLACAALSACSGSSDAGNGPGLPSGGAAGQTAGADAGGSDGLAGSAPSAGQGGAAAGTSGGAGLAGSPGSAGAAPVVGTADFGPNVLIFDPTMPMATIQTQVSAIATKMAARASQFSTDRYAYFFKPGAYQVDVKLGYYMQVLGLGAKPDDVQITGAVRSRADWNNGNATLNFWRSAENFSVTSNVDQNMNLWAVSQGSALRRAHLKGALGLSDGGYSSGGFVADVQVDGAVSSGSQQQFFSRNASWTSWAGGVWNMVFVGIPNAPTAAWPTAPNTVVAQAPVLREKPYLTFDAQGHYAVNVPALSSNVVGPSFTPGTALSIDTFYVTQATDTAATMNAALAAGKNLLLTPGVYHLDASLQVSRADTVVLGLGLATLVPDKGTAALSVADVDGVKIAGIIVDAGAMNSNTLIEIGTAGGKAVHTQNPTSLHDLYCRVGGASLGTATSCATIHSSDVIGDNLWMWRADHGTGAGWTSNTSKNGLIVNGDRVTIYGLFVEHFQEYQTIWNGNGGRTYFYQSELPYDPPTQTDWQHGGVNGYASYKIADTVTSHEAWGLGIYSAFKNAVVCESAIEAPTAAGVVLHHAMTSWLNGNAASAINHIVNTTGNAATTSSRQSISPN